MVSLRGARSIPVEVEYLWFSGAVISTPHALRRGQKVEIIVRPDVARVGIVTFGRDRRYTCLFDLPIQHGEVEGGLHGLGVARIIG